MASTYLQRTQTAGNRKTFTMSAWVKLAFTSNSNNIVIFNANTGTTDHDALRFMPTNQLEFFSYNGAYQCRLITNRIFRDTNAWYHIVVKVDTTQATSSDRVKIYVNGVQETSFSTETYPSQNYDFVEFNNNSDNIEVGARARLSEQYFNGIMAHVHWVDGTAYDASAFGETDATSGIWKPKTAPSVTYGTNGFFLKFANSGSLGTDSSGNGNNLTVNGTGTQTLDTPSNVFATFNPLIKTGAVFSNGNLSFSCGALGSYQGSMATIIPTKGKWYGEIKVTADANLQIGFITADTLIDGARNVYSSSSNIYWQDNVTEIRYYLNSVSQGNATVTGGTNSVPTYATNDIIMLAMDLDNGYGWFGKNGTWQNSGNPASGTNAFNLASDYANGTTFFTGALDASVTANFGNGYFGTSAISTPYNDGDGFGKFQYQPPTGYYALCTKNINTYG